VVWAARDPVTGESLAVK